MGCVLWCFVLFFVGCNSGQSSDRETLSTEEVEDSTTLEEAQEEIYDIDTLGENANARFPNHDNAEGDTTPVRSYTTIADNEMLNPTPKSIEDYKPDARGVYEINWLTLTDVKFEEKIAPEDSALYLFPTFGKIVKSLDGKKVSLKGFIIPVDVATHFYVLSANPYSSCFFCGKAGPESIMELQLKSDPTEAYEMDRFTTFEGTFELNGTDINHCNYILKNAVLVGE